MSEASEKPIIVQGSEAPVFKGVDGPVGDLMCAGGCGGLLIKHYYPDCFISVSISCFRCRHVTTTSSVIDGDVLCARLIKFNAGDSALISGTVNYPPSIMVAGEESARNVILKTMPVKPSKQPILSLDFLQDLKRRFQYLTDVDYEHQQSIIKRGGHNVVFEFPMVWALDILLTSINRQQFITRQNLNDSISTVSLFWYIVETWGHHSRFSHLARHLAEPRGFFHMAYTFKVAEILYHAGNMIGLSLEDNHGKANPDLYFKYAADDPYFIEIKAPPYLQIGYSDTVARKSYKSIVAATVKKASVQVNRKHPGIIAIAASRSMPNLVSGLDRARDAFIATNGYQHLGLAGLMTICPEYHSANGALDGSILVATTANRHFFRPGVIKIGG